MRNFIFLLFFTIVTILAISIYSSIYLFEIISVQVGYALLILLLLVVLIVRKTLTKKLDN